MAERRMFAKKVTNDDSFMQLSASAQALYFHLAMSADDDGFCNQITVSMFKAHASTQDLQSLLEQQYIYQFESGIVVILHWKIHNSIRNDRYKETMYQEERMMLTVKENGAYTTMDTVGIPVGNQLDTIGIPNGNQMDTQVRLGKVSLGKGSLGKASPEEEKTADSVESAPPPPKAAPMRHKYGEYQNVLLSDGDLKKLQAEFPDDWQERIERLSSYMASTGKHYQNHLATIRNWAQSDAKSQPFQQPASGQNLPQEQQHTTSYCLEEIKKLKNCI